MLRREAQLRALARNRNRNANESKGKYVFDYIQIDDKLSRREYTQFIYRRLFRGARNMCH